MLEHSLRKQFKREKALEVFAWVALVIATCYTVSRAFSRGRAGSSPIYDDVAYALSGQTYAIRAREGGFLDGALSLFSEGPHSPFSESISFIVHLISLDFSEGLYLVNVVLALGYFFLLARFFAHSRLSQVLLVTLLIASPAGYLAIDEFRPDVFYIFAGVLTLLVQPFSRTRLSKRLASFDVSLLLSLSLLFIKPSWAVFSAGILLIVVSQRIVSTVLRRKIVPGGFWLKRLVLTLAVGSFWFGWVGKDHFFDYVFSTVDKEWFSAGSAVGAIVGSLGGILGAFGAIGLVAIALTFLGLEIAIFLSWRQASTLQRIMLVQLQAPFIASGLGLLATAVSQHPSRFQGMFIFYFFLAGLFGLTLYYFREVKLFNWPDMPITRGLFLAGILVFLLNPTTQSFGPEFRNPGSVTQQLATSIAVDVRNRCATSAKSAPKVSVAFAETVSPEGVLYHLRGSEGIGNATLVGVDFSLAEAKEVEKQVSNSNYVVVRSEPFLANRLPLNSIQADLAELLTAKGEIIGEFKAWDDGNYLVINQSKNCAD